MLDTTTRAARVAAGIASVSLALAALWSAAIRAAVTVPSMPTGGNDLLFAWWRPVEWQTASVHLMAALGFAALAVLGGLLGSRSDGVDHPVERAAGLLITGGAFMGGLAELVQLGAQQGVLVASSTSTDPDLLGAIGFAFDRVVAALQLGAYAALAAGAFTVAAAVRRSVPALAAASVLLGLGTAVLAALTQTDPLGFGDVATAIVAVILLPAWAWTAAFRAPRSSGQLAPAI